MQMLTETLNIKRYVFNSKIQIPVNVLYVYLLVLVVNYLETYKLFVLKVYIFSHHI